jgi:hypothetical protein
MFHARAADQAHAASMPGTTWPVIGHPPGPAPAARSMATVSMPRLNVTTRQQRFGFTHLPGPHLTPHWCLFHIAHHDGLQPTQHVVVWSLPPKGDSEGPAFISRTAPTPGGLTYLRIKTSVRRSWRTLRRSVVMSGSSPSEGDPEGGQGRLNRKLLGEWQAAAPGGAGLVSAGCDCDDACLGGQATGWGATFLPERCSSSRIS